VDLCGPPAKNPALAGVAPPLVSSDHPSWRGDRVPIAELCRSLKCAYVSENRLGRASPSHAFGPVLRSARAKRTHQRNGQWEPTAYRPRTYARPTGAARAASPQKRSHRGPRGPGAWGLGPGGWGKRDLLCFPPAPAPNPQALLLSPEPARVKSTAFLFCVFCVFLRLQNSRSSSSEFSQVKRWC
jgi:hypothetical protein